MSALVAIGDGHWLRDDAAASLARARADGAPAGCVTSSTRTPARQQELYDHQGQPGWPAMADLPAKSKHVYRPGQPDEGGRAIDCDDPLRTWLRTQGGPYGWSFPIPSELWHAEYDAAGDVFRGAPAGEHDTIPARIEEDDPMHERALQAAYRKWLGRTPCDAEVDDRLVRIGLGQSSIRTEILAVSRSEEARRWPVQQIALAEIGRRLSAADVDLQLNAHHGDLVAIRAAIHAAPEATAYRARRSAGG